VLKNKASAVGAPNLKRWTHTRLCLRSDKPLDVSHALSEKPTRNDRTMTVVGACETSQRFAFLV